jgi:hypothetical protein
MWKFWPETLELSTSDWETTRNVPARWNSNDRKLSGGKVWAHATSCPIQADLDLHAKCSLGINKWLRTGTSPGPQNCEIEGPINDW